MRLALFQPDIPHNVGAMIRLGACLSAAIEIIEPCAFPLTDKGLWRAALDYAEHARVARHRSWQVLTATRRAGERGLLLTTKANQPYWTFRFAPGDTLIVGGESQGVPAAVHDAADARLIIPMVPGLRSLNVITVAAIVLAEALRQTGSFPLLQAATP
ncbi:MAG: tRNA (cytidine(34)-2'-O)-methyltransferase [Alphaproteobacteria bacterium]|nr:tRNA (cytidine(34)-2'-O)-methyltransferase [Alphaproteobacteria bacterium]